MPGRSTPSTGFDRWRPARTAVVTVTRETWVDALRVLTPRAVALDVEPLVVLWSTPPAAVAAAARDIEREAAGVTSVEVLEFVTNSSRPRPPGLRAPWSARARKPWCAAALAARHPGPWAVVGDQILTDGLLAHRLGGTFLHLADPVALRSGPTWPRVQAMLGRVVERAFFTPTST